jgi:hypothetical protein
MEKLNLNNIMEKSVKHFNEEEIKLIMKNKNNDSYELLWDDLEDFLRIKLNENYLKYCTAKKNNLNIASIWEDLVNFTSLFCEVCVFGLWVHGLWLGIKDMPFEEQKELFFRVFEKLLKDGKIIVVDDCIENYDWLSKDRNWGQLVSKPILSKPTLELFPKDTKQHYWNEESKTIIEHIRYIFPKYITENNQRDLYDWFYDMCPRIGWVDPESGSVTVS